MEAAPGVRLVVLDVASPESIRSALATVERALGPGAPLDALINNAGIAVAGPSEALPVSEWRRQFEVNFFGVLSVTEAALPLLRRAGGRGRIVNIGSVAGRLAMPLLGPYCASKHALAAYSDALGAELSVRGLQVTLIEPASFRTAIWGKARNLADDLVARCNAEALAPYLPLLRKASERVGEVESKAPEPTAVVLAVRRALEAERAPARRLVGAETWFLRVLQRVPAALRARGARKAFLRMARKAEGAG